MIKQYIATKAFVMHSERILIIREAGKYRDGTHQGKFDLPGGRIDPGEALAAGLVREVKEETGLDIEIGQPFFANEALPAPVVDGDTLQIIRIFFTCRASTLAVKLSADHDSYEWINPSEFKSYPIITNLVPAFEAFIRTLE